MGKGFRFRLGLPPWSTEDSRIQRNILKAIRKRNKGERRLKEVEQLVMNDAGPLFLRWVANSKNFERLSDMASKGEKRAEEHRRYKTAITYASVREAESHFRAWDIKDVEKCDATFKAALLLGGFAWKEAEEGILDYFQMRHMLGKEVSFAHDFLPHLTGFVEKAIKQSQQSHSFLNAATEREARAYIQAAEEFGTFKQVEDRIEKLGYGDPTVKIKRMDVTHGFDDLTGKHTQDPKRWEEFGRFLDVRRANFIRSLMRK